MVIALGKRPLGRPRRKWKCILEIDFEAGAGLRCLLMGFGRLLGLLVSVPQCWLVDVFLNHVQMLLVIPNFDNI